MNTDCFGSNYIGIRGCGDAAPDSGIYINDLPGISMKLMADVANDEVVQGKELIRRMEQEAIKLTAQDAVAALVNKVEFKGLVAADTQGYIGDEYEAPESRYVGFEIEKLDDDVYTRILLNWFRFKPDTADVSTTVYVEDGPGTTATEYDITTSANVKNQVDITTQEINEDIVRVYIDTQGFNLATTGDGWGNFSNCVKCRKSTGNRSWVRYIQSDDATTWTYETQHGIGISFGLMCSVSELLCIFRDELKYAIRYRLGGLLMQQVMHTNRNNVLVRNSKDDAEKLYEMWMGNGTTMQERMASPFSNVTNKSEYKKSLETAIERAAQMISRQDTICTECRDSKIITMMP